MRESTKEIYRTCEFCEMRMMKFEIDESISEDLNAQRLTDRYLECIDHINATSKSYKLSGITEAAKKRIARTGRSLDFQYQAAMKTIYM